MELCVGQQVDGNKDWIGVVSNMEMKLGKAGLKGKGIV